MKKIFGLLVLGLSLGLNSFAADSAANDLNLEFEKILAPLQNQLTAAWVKFAAIETDATRALKLDVAAYYFKMGALTNIEFKLDRLSYEYGNGLTPTTKLKASVATDFAKLFSQETVNQMVPGTEQIVTGFAKDFTRQYGNAVTVDVKVTDKVQDKNGNFTAIKATFVGSVDLAKLPQNVKAEDVIFTSVKLALVVNVHSGLTIYGQVISNPQYRGFKRDGEGLKEYLEKLRTRDERTLKSFAEAAKSFDRSMTDLANNKRF